jgi:hypothetical protein
MNAIEFPAPTPPHHRDDVGHEKGEVDRRARPSDTPLTTAMEAIPMMIG